MGCKISLVAKQTSIRKCGQMSEFHIFVPRNAAPAVPPEANARLLVATAGNEL